jgi:hypothetical protein
MKRRNPLKSCSLLPSSQHKISCSGSRGFDECIFFCKGLLFGIQLHTNIFPPVFLNWLSILYGVRLIRFFAWIFSLYCLKCLLGPQISLILHQISSTCCYSCKSRIRFIYLFSWTKSRIKLKFFQSFSSELQIGIWDERKVFGTRVESLKDDILGGSLPTLDSNGRHSNPSSNPSSNPKPARKESGTIIKVSFHNIVMHFLFLEFVIDLAYWNEFGIAFILMIFYCRNWLLVGFLKKL